MFPSLLIRPLLVAVLAALSACGTTVLPLSYTPAVALTVAGPPVVGTVTGLDQRGETTADARWFGAIRGGFGNPLKRLEADRPIADVAADAVRAGLGARGLLAAADTAAQYSVAVVVEQFESDQVARREAKVRLRLVWKAAGPGQAAFTSEGHADVVTGSLITLEEGVFGSPQELQATAAQALSQAVDAALDDPALRRFLAQTH